MPKVRFVDGQNYAAHIRYQQFCTSTKLYMGLLYARYISPATNPMKEPANNKLSRI